MITNLIVISLLTATRYSCFDLSTEELAEELSNPLQEYSLPCEVSNGYKVRMEVDVVVVDVVFI